MHSINSLIFQRKNGHYFTDSDELVPRLYFGCPAFTTLIQNLYILPPGGTDTDKQNSSNLLACDCQS